MREPSFAFDVVFNHTKCSAYFAPQVIQGTSSVMENERNFWRRSGAQAAHEKQISGTNEVSQFSLEAPPRLFGCHRGLRGHQKDC